MNRLFSFLLLSSLLFSTLPHYIHHPTNSTTNSTTSSLPLSPLIAKAQWWALLPFLPCNALIRTYVHTYLRTDLRTY